MKQRISLVLRFLLRCFQGAVVGAGAILPGVSGGVLCAAFGYYEPMMALLSHPKDCLRTYYKMFIPFVIGWLLGFVVLAGVMEVFFEKAAFLALMLFAGLIFGTMPDMFRTSLEKGENKNWSPFILSFAIVYIFFLLLDGGSGSITVTPNVFWYMFCGGLWGLSLVLPGFTSSSILIFLGLFQPMTAGIAVMDMSVILPFIAGIVLVALLTARLVNRLYEKNYALISRIVLGFMLTSTVLILPTSFSGIGELLIGIAGFVGGYIFAVWMDRTAEKMNAVE